MNKQYNAALSIILLHVACFSLTLYPLLSVTVLPFTDYANHLARIFIIYNEKRLPGIEKMYYVHWEVAPYVAMDVLIMFFQRFMDIYAAGKLFVSLSFLLIVLGVLTLNIHIYKRLSYLTLLVYPFLYNLALVWGFINFIFGMGLALVSFVIWLKLREKLTLPRILLFFILLTANYFSHLISYAILGFAMVLYEVFSRETWKQCIKRLFLLAALAAPHMLLWLLAPKQVMVLGTDFGNATDIVNMLLAPSWFQYTWYEPVILYLALLCIYFPGVTVEKRMACTVIVMAIISLAIPVKLMGIYLANIRLPVFLMFLLIAASRINREAFMKWKVVYGVFFVSLIIISVLRYNSMTYAIQDCGNKADEFRSAIHELFTVPEVPILTLKDYKGFACPLPRAVNHLNTLGVIESGVFVPEVFTIIPPVKPTPAFEDVDVAVGEPADTARFFTEGDAKEKSTQYKYIVLFDGDTKRYHIPSTWQLLRQGSFFSIYDNQSFKRGKDEAKP